MHQTMTSVSTATAVTTLACTDIQQEAGFFRDTLGMRVEMMPGLPGYGMVAAGRGTYLMCYQRPSMPHCDATAMTFVVDDVRSTVEELRGRGVRFEEYDLPEQGIKTVEGIASLEDGSKGAWFKDPSGNLLSLTEMSSAGKSAMSGMSM
ncbi:MAG: VOC family protein [Coriobacteriia bacterium]|nr:VOC family protein [Coriobacteriia bacterium]